MTHTEPTFIPNDVDLEMAEAHAAANEMHYNLCHGHCASCGEPLGNELICRSIGRSYRSKREIPPVAGADIVLGFHNDCVPA